VPELPEVERVRLELAPAMTGQVFVRVRLHRADLRRPFPKRFAERLRGRTVLALTRRGKYLVAPLSSGEQLLMHLGMSGSFRVHTRPSAEDRRIRDILSNPHDHVVFEMSSGEIIIFNDPRRFGVMDLLSAGAGDHELGLPRLGPEPLDEAFDAAALARRCAGRRVSLKVALLDQRVVAGLGNIYASEALHAARLSPRRPASTLATRGRRPTDHAVRLVRAIKTVLHEAIARDDDSANPFRVYDRAGSRCRRRGCRGVVRRFWQAGRSTFYCPVCQR
jgi:formamidopyrimidine-DNA glycosylase